MDPLAPSYTLRPDSQLPTSRPSTPNDWAQGTRDIVVFSGGSAANSLVDLFRNIVNSKRCRLSYVIPISDNGGSSSELIRVFGGPGTTSREHIQSSSLSRFG